MKQNGTDSSAAPELIKFGVFEVHAGTGELRKHGLRLKLADQPFRILIALLRRPGELLSREELRELIWPGEPFGDLEQRLNRTVGKLREVLGDSASNPRFVETLPGRGYRYIGPIEKAPSTGIVVAQPSRHRRAILIGVASVVLIALIAGGVWLFLPPSVPDLRWRKLTTDNYDKIGPALSDGTRIYFLAAYSGEQFIAQVSPEGGHPTRLPITLPGPYCALQDLSRDGQELLLTASATLNRRSRVMPLWTLRVADGTARRLGEITAVSAAYAPSASIITYSVEGALWVANQDGTEPRKILELKDSRIDSVHWSPDGTEIRFARRDPVSRSASTWEVRSNGSGLRPVFADWSISNVPVGWTADDRFGLFAAAGTFWTRPRARISLVNNTGAPEQMLTDAPEFNSSIRPRQTDVFYAIGTDRLGELQRFDARSEKWIPVLDGISAAGAEYSKNGQRLAYVTYPGQSLWVRQADGSKPIQLTSLPFTALLPRWSPDGRRIAFVGQEAPDKPIRLYVVDSEGGVVRPLLPSEPGSQGYPTWSPDGEQLLYGIMGSNTLEAPYIRTVDLRTGKVSKFEGSDGLYGPRWSPDGSMIAALQWGGEHHLMIYHVREKRWEEIPGLKVDWPTWTPDSRFILFQGSDVLMKFDRTTRKAELVTRLKQEEAGGFLHSLGVSNDGSPLRTLKRDSQQIYELRFRQK